MDPKRGSPDPIATQQAIRPQTCLGPDPPLPSRKILSPSPVLPTVNDLSQSILVEIAQEKQQIKGKSEAVE